MEEREITIQKLLDISGYSTRIIIVRSDTGSVVIQSVKALANSKDKRQMAKWEVFKDMPVYGIAPTVDIKLFKRYRDYFNLAIEATIYVGDYNKAMKKISETSAI